MGLKARSIVAFFLAKLNVGFEKWTACMLAKLDGFIYA